MSVRRLFMVERLTKTGNSLALVIDRPILEATSIDATTPLEVSTDGPRHDFIYWTDDGSVAALRYDDWKVTFLKQNAHGLAVWQTPFEELRAPMLGNLRRDPFERAEYQGYGYNRWYAE